jgi:hypothetical protein
MSMYDDLAVRADRALRTSSARRIAVEIYELARDAMRQPGSPVGGSEERILEALSQRPGWRRRADREFICSFSGRNGSMAIPRPFDFEVLTRLIARVEVNVFLGDCEPAMLKDLQFLSQRELQRLLDSAEHEPSHA